tara:strand:- start:15384 stop:15569 length:186 start_codon:yes stop_codon:yes gene_type:complete
MRDYLIVKLKDLVANKFIHIERAQQMLDSYDKDLEEQGEDSAIERALDHINIIINTEGHGE